jgi:hypothetical protein
VKGIHPVKETPVCLMPLKINKTINSTLSRAGWVNFLEPTLMF